MKNRYAEDFKKGDIFDLGEHTFSEEEIVDFAINMTLSLSILIKMLRKKRYLEA